MAQQHQSNTRVKMSSPSWQGNVSISSPSNTLSIHGNNNTACYLRRRILTAAHHQHVIALASAHHPCVFGVMSKEPVSAFNQPIAGSQRRASRVNWAWQPVLGGRGDGNTPLSATRNEQPSKGTTSSMGRFQDAKPAQYGKYIQKRCNPNILQHGIPSPFAYLCGVHCPLIPLLGWWGKRSKSVFVHGILLGQSPSDKDSDKTFNPISCQYLNPISWGSRGCLIYVHLFCSECLKAREIKPCLIHWIIWAIFSLARLIH